MYLRSGLPWAAATYVDFYDAYGGTAPSGALSIFPYGPISAWAPTLFVSLYIRKPNIGKGAREGGNREYCAGGVPAKDVFSRKPAHLPT